MWVPLAVSAEERVRPEEQFNRLQTHFARCDNTAKGILLTAYCKMAVCYGGAIATGVDRVLATMATVFDAELQQRAVEYHHLPRLSPATLEIVLGDMPPYATAENVLERLDQARRLGNKNQAQFLPDAGKEKGEAGDGSNQDDAEEGAGGATETKAAETELNLTGIPTSAAPAPAPASSAGRTLVKVTDEMKPKVVAWFQAFGGASKGVLYEDAALQIGCQIAITEAEGVVNVFFGNKTATPFKAFRVRVQATPQLAVTQVDATPSEVPPGAQVKVAFNVACVMVRHVAGISVCGCGMRVR